MIQKEHIAKFDILFLYKNIKKRKTSFSYVTKSCVMNYVMERVKGIEPSSSAWKAEVLPLNYTRIVVVNLSNQRN